MFVSDIVNILRCLLHRLRLGLLLIIRERMVRRFVHTLILRRREFL